ncbi:MAG: class II aldolase/adducin family protein, partial [Novosphingobium sp.]
MTDFAEIERRARRELAAALRLIARFGWDDHVATHMSARLPDGSFLLNPFGLMFDEVTASCFLRVAIDGTVIDNPGGWPLNPAAFNIHAGVLAGRPDAMSV